jgi:hypothetical protein
MNMNTDMSEDMNEDISPVAGTNGSLTARTLVVGPWAVTAGAVLKRPRPTIGGIDGRPGLVSPDLLKEGHTVRSSEEEDLIL